jgi:hypothetical protein
MNTDHKKTIYEALGREPVHPFPARMAPGIALQVMSGMKESRVLDPMMGSGTVLAMARAKGHRAVGFDVDPLAVLISKVWTTATYPEEIRDIAQSVFSVASVEFKNISQGDAYPVNADEETSKFIRYWFDGYARRQLAALSIAIRTVKSEDTRNSLWCAFSRLIITKQAGASRAMDLSHSRPHRVYTTAPVKPFNKFLSAVERVVANSIDKRAADCGPETMVNCGDARSLPIPDGSIDLVLTSPPYLNAIDYMRCSKFSLVWMGYGVGELRLVRAKSVGTEIGNLTLEDKGIRSIISALKLEPKLGQRNERILAKYIFDMRSAVSEVGRVLASQGKAVYVVGENTLKGTYIRTSVIVLKLAELAGLALDEQWKRVLPSNRRYLPPPSSAAGTMDARMRREIVMVFTK